MWAHGAIYAAMGKVGIYTTFGVTFATWSYVWVSDVWHCLWILYPVFLSLPGFVVQGK
jgi:hypothetical protein